LGFIHSLGYLDVDKCSYINAFSRCSPITKLCFSLSGILISVSAPSPFVPIIVFAVVTVLLLIFAEVPVKLYFKLMMFPMFFAIMSCFLIALFFGSENPIAHLRVQGYEIIIFGDAVRLASTLFFRVLGGVSSIFFLSLTTPMMDIWIVLRKIGIPSVLVEVSILTYRYLFVLLEVASRMHLAQELRLGYSTMRRTFQSLYLLVTNLFIETLLQGERTFNAMTARGYDGTIRVVDEVPKPGLRAVVGIAVFDALMVFLIILRT
jgi:cobalt/nickel transport system permease protein